jgi:hypothetical protein
MSKPMGHPEELLDEESEKEAVKLIKCQNQNDRAYKTLFRWMVVWKPTSVT